MKKIILTLFLILGLASFAAPNFVPKKQKVKDYHISVLYITDKNLSGASLDKVVDNVLNEAESFLK